MTAVRRMIKEMAPTISRAELNFVASVIVQAMIGYERLDRSLGTTTLRK